MAVDTVKKKKKTLLLDQALNLLNPAIADRVVRIFAHCIEL